MEKLLEILEELKPGIDFSKEENLIADGILDSLSIITLVSEISGEFDVEITPMEIVPENFRSADTIFRMITRLQEEE